MSYLSKCKITIIFILMLQVHNYKLIACDCVRPTLEEAVRKYNDVIFVGVLHEKIDSTNLYSTSPFGPVKYYNFNVIKYHKGLSKDNWQISILQEGSNCDFPYEDMNIGDTLLIYGNTYKFGFGYFVEANACSRTKLISQIEDKLEFRFYTDDKLWKAPILISDDKASRKQIIIDETEKERNKKYVGLFLILSLTTNLVLSFILYKKLR